MFVPIAVGKSGNGAWIRAGRSASRAERNGGIRLVCQRTCNEAAESAPSGAQRSNSPLTAIASVARSRAAVPPSVPRRESARLGSPQAPAVPAGSAAAADRGAFQSRSTPVTWPSDLLSVIVSGGECRAKRTSGGSIGSALSWASAANSGDFFMTTFTGSTYRSRRFGPARSKSERSILESRGAL